MLKLYPMPVEIIKKEGKYEFLYVSVFGLKNEIILDTYKKMGITLENKEKANVKYFKKDGLGVEEYEIIINENGADIFYSELNGAFYATQTLCQLIAKKSVSYLHIKDKPLHEDRKFQLDVSRGKIPKMEHFKEIIENCASARYNVFALYYDRIVFQFPSLEGLWEDDAITIDELYEIKKWCNERFMKFTFSLETFGHLGNFLKLDCFKHLSNAADENGPHCDLNPLLPESVDFADMLLSDIMPFVDTDYLLVGFDEVGSLKTGKTKEEFEKKGKAKVFIEFLNKINNLIQEKYKKTPIFWCDMFFGPKATEVEIRELLEMFPKNAIVGDWGYEQEYEYHHFSRNNRLCREAGLKFFNYASTGLFNQYIPRTYNQTLNAEVACRAAYENGGRSVCQTLWGDLGNSQFYAMELGGIFTFGSTAWNYKDFQLSYVHEYMNKYIYKADNCNFAGIVASFGEAAWLTKGKCPNSNQFVFAAKSSFTTDILWNGYHAHTGIDKIRINDMVDIYGCEKAISFVDMKRKELEEAKIDCENAQNIKEKLLLNVRMFEWSIKLGYFKLCIHTTKDYEKARELTAEINFCTKDICDNFYELWITENRPNFGENFPDYVRKCENEFNEFINKTAELK